MIIFVVMCFKLGCKTKSYYAEASVSWRPRDLGKSGILIIKSTRTLLIIDVQMILSSRDIALTHDYCKKKKVQDYSNLSIRIAGHTSFGYARTRITVRTSASSFRWRAFRLEIFFRPFSMLKRVSATVRRTVWRGAKTFRIDHVFSRTRHTERTVYDYVLS